MREKSIIFWLSIGLVFCLIVSMLCLKWGYTQRGNYLQWKANAETLGKQSSWYVNKIDSSIVSSNLEIKGARRDILSLYPGMKEEIFREFNVKLNKVIWYNKNVFESNRCFQAYLRDTIQNSQSEGLNGFEEITSVDTSSTATKIRYFDYKDEFFTIHHLQKGNNIKQSISYKDTIYQVIRKADKDSVYKGTGFGWWFRKAPLEQEIKLGCKNARVTYSRVIHVN